MQRVFTKYVATLYMVEQVAEPGYSSQ